MGRSYDWSRIVRVGALAGLITLAITGSSSVLVAQSGPPLTPFRGLIDHVSANVTGRLPNASVNLASRAISADGRYVVMDSWSYDLVENDFNYSSDVFLRDRMTGTTTRVSVASDGSEGNDMSQTGSISSDGRHVVFMSGASNLVAGDTNGHWDVFVRDLDAGRTVRVNVATDGTQAADQDSYWPAISANGRFVAFTSGASTLVPGASPYQPPQAYIHDRDADGNGVFDEAGGTTTTLASVSVDGTFADSYVDHVRVSSDGRFVLFESPATNLDPAGNPNQSNHLYVRDLQTNQTTLIDRAVTGGPSGSGIDYRTSDMSDDGRYVSYASPSNDIVPFDVMNWQNQIFRYDRDADPPARTTLISALPDGTIANSGGYATSISGDGRYVAFTSTASNLASPAPAPGTGGVVVRDMLDGTFTRVDVIDGGAPFDHAYPYYPSISADGTAVAFQSDAVNAVDGQFSWYASSHVFVATAFAITPTSTAYPAAGGSGSIDVNATTVSGWNAVSLDSWIVLTDGGGFGAGPRTVQYNVAPNDTGIIRFGRIRVGSTIVSIRQDGDGDTTPPVITPIVTGTVGGDGWYVGDVMVRFDVEDPESAIIGQGYNCGVTTTIASDAIYAPVTCEATSHGGTSSNSVVIRRDTTPPAIAIAEPGPSAYVAGSHVVPSFTCTDSNGYSGVATCAISEGSSPLDTTPGRHVFTVTATDRAGNSTTKSVEYLVGTGACVVPNDSLKAWWRFDGDTFDALGNLYAAPVPASQQYYAPGLAGQSWQGQATAYLDTNDGDRLLAWNGLTVSAWVKPTAWMGESATIVSKPGQYRIARFPDGTLRWAFNHSTGFTWVNTGVILPGNAWTHVAVTYDAGLVKTYVNGRLVHTQQLDGTLLLDQWPPASMTIGGRADVTAFYFGWLDELQVFTSALTASDVEAIALAGDGGLCVPKTTTVTAAVAPSVGFGPTFPVTATLRDGDGHPVAGKTMAFWSYIAPDGFAVGTAVGVTDASGVARADAPIAPNATLGTYAHGVNASFDGDAHYTPSQSVSSVTVVRGTPAITWPPSSPIVYGTALGSSQLNATANAAGTFSYSPAAGTILDAGTRTLTVTFTPYDVDRLTQTTATMTLVVNKAAPVVTITGGTFTYDKLPHPAVAIATGVLGEPLSPVQIYYNQNSQIPPVSPGFNWAGASYAGSANYTSGFAGSVPLIINRAVPTVTITGGPFTFDGATHQAIVTVRGAGGDYLSPYGVFFDGGYNLPLQAGTHTVRVQYNGDFNYEAVTVDGTLVINKATPAIWVSDATVTYNGNPRSVGASATGVHSDPLSPVNVTYDGSATAPTAAGVHAVEARYDGSTNYNAASKSATLTILKAAPSVTWATPAGIAYGTALDATQLNATASVPGTFSYSPDAGTVLDAGTHTLTTTFTPTDVVNYQTKSANVTLDVARASSAITWNAPADIVYGAALSATQLNATANVTGTFTYSPGAGVVPGAGSQTLSVTFTPDDAANYTGSTSSTTLNVTKAGSTITWNAPADVVYGTALGATQLNATASVAGTFTYSPAAGVVLGAGSQTLSVTFTPDDAANHTGATSSTTLNVTKAASTIAWMAPGAITYGTTLSAAQLNATADVPGTFAYSPALGAMLSAGSYVLSATFTPSDPTNYTGSSSTRSLTVNRAPLTIATIDASKPYGAPLPPFFASGSGFVNGDSLASLTGTVTFATSATASSPVGTYAVTPQGVSSSNYTITFVNGTVTVLKAATQTTVAVSANPSGLNQAVTLTATVSVVAPGAGSPSGSIQFFDGSVLLGSASLAGATASLTTNGFSAGTHTISAIYSGDASFATSSGPRDLTVNTSSSSSTTTVTSSSNPATLGANVTFTATISAPAGLSGTVAFYDGAVLIGSAAVSGTTARLTTAALASGGHAITARYLGNAAIPPSTSRALAQYVQPSGASRRASTVALVASPSPATLGSLVMLTATATGSNKQPPTGQVTFMLNGSVLGQGTLSTTGNVTAAAALGTSTLAHGTHTVEAVYLGNGTYRASTTAITLVVN